MNIILSKTHKKLITISTLNTLGSGVIWTGLPVYMYTITNSYIYTSILFITGSLARILTMFFSGHLVDRYSKKRLLLWTILINLIVTLLMFFVLQNKFLWVLFPTLILSQMLGSIDFVCLNMWYNEISKNNLVKLISVKNLWEMIAKTLSFSIGPLIFLLFNENTFLIQILMLVFCILLINSMTYSFVGEIDLESNKLISILKPIKIIFSKKDLKILLYVFILEGIVLPTVINLSVYILNNEYTLTTRHLAFFWLIGGIGNVVSNAVLVKTNINNLPKPILALVTIVFVSGGILLMAFSSIWQLYLLGFLCMTLGNPVIGNLVRSRSYIASPSNYKGRVNSLLNAFTDLGTFLAINATFLFVPLYQVEVLIVLSMLACLRSILFFFFNTIK